MRIIAKITGKQDGNEIMDAEIFTEEEIKMLAVARLKTRCKDSVINVEDVRIEVKFNETNR